VPKLWDDTIEEHRRAVHHAILDATAGLVAAHGLAAVTMSQVAQATGIGRATLYKYFSDIQSIMTAWHQRQVAAHLDRLAGVEGPDRLTAVLQTYARMLRVHHGHPLAAILHHGEHLVPERGALRDFVAGVISDAAAAGEVRTDVPPAELADYALSALAAAGRLPSDAAAGRLVRVTVDGLRPPR
jgi:AcrR family transcriptional regulator